MDKYFRAEAAVASGGCDLVLELTYPYSCSAAEFFAKAGVHIAAQFCDAIAFGCEEINKEILKDIASYTLSTEFSSELSSFRKKNPEVSLAIATEVIIRKALSKEHANAATLPNNILAVEYLKAIYAGNYPLEPIFIQRRGADHDSKQPSKDICSASFLRNSINAENEWKIYCPKETEAVIERAEADGMLSPSLINAERAILYALRTIPPEKAELCSECAGGLGRRIIKTASEATSLDELYSLLATKRYTNARIRRAMIAMITGASEINARSLPEFTCLLAANKNGLSLIKRSSFPVISTMSDLRELTTAKGIDLFLNAERLSTLCYKAPVAEYNIFKKRPIILEK
jgi:predicted nucleotidyltransferase